jgi:hypothetical protein
MQRIIAHWLRAYEIFLDDSLHLPPERVLLTRYEDFVSDPASELSRIWRFLEVPPAPVDTTVREGINDRYFEAWQGNPRNLAHAAYRAMMIRRFEGRARAFGYSLADPTAEVTPASRVRQLL